MDAICDTFKRAGLEPWPKLFQNLRASRESELLATYPAKDVVAWLGNSVEVALNHYAMTSDEQFQIAAAIPPQQSSGIKSGGAISSNLDNIPSAPESIEKAVSPRKNGLLNTYDVGCQQGTSGRTKIRKSSDVSGENDESGLAVTSAVTFDAELRCLIEAWSRLSDAKRTAIVKIANS